MALALVLQLSLMVGVWEGVPLPVDVALGVWLCVGVWDRDCVLLAVSMGEGGAPKDRVAVGLEDTVLVGVPLKVRVQVVLGVGVGVELALMPRALFCAACRTALRAALPPAPLPGRQ